MPLILEIEYADGTREEMRIPAEIWRRDSKRVSKLLMTTKEIVRLTLDPHLETADTDLEDNHYPPKPQKTRFQLFKDKKKKNPMQEARAADEEAGDEDDAEGDR